MYNVGAAAEGYSLTWSKMAKHFSESTKTAPDFPILLATTSFPGDPIQFKS